MTSPYGTTSPCARIAAEMGVSQAFVDWLMEWKLWEAGIRTNAPYHTGLYLQPGDPSPRDAELMTMAWTRIDLAIADIKDDAARRRAEAAL